MLKVKKEYEKTINDRLLKIKTWKINESMFNEWTSPDICIPIEKKKGCAIDAMNFLKIIPNDLGDFLSKMRTQIEDKGTSYSDTYKLLNIYNENKNVSLIFNEFTIWSRTQFNDLYNYLFERIESNHAILFNFFLSSNKSNDYVSHTVILMKVIINGILQLIFVEPQLHNYSNHNRDYYYYHEDFTNYFA